MLWRSLLTDFYPFAALRIIPNLVRVNCASLVDASYLADHQSLCPSSFFFGSSALCNGVSVTLVIIGTTYALPLNLFFGTLIVSNARIFNCCQIYGRLIRADVRSDPDYPALDFKVRLLHYALVL